MFKCSQFNTDSTTLRLKAGEYVYKESMNYLGNNTYVVFTKGFGPFTPIKRGIIFKKVHDNLTIVDTIKFEDEFSEIKGQIYTKVQFGNATHLVFSDQKRKIHIYDINRKSWSSH